MTQPAGNFQLQIERVHDYELRVHFDKPSMPDAIVDEPPPLGHDAGPNPARMLAAAVGSCLTASFIFCMSRAQVEIRDIRTDVRVDLVRNDQKRLRIGRIAVALRPVLDDPAAISHCAEAYEDFCVVTQSVREGLTIDVLLDAQPTPPLNSDV